MKIVIFILMIFVFSGLLIISNNNLNIFQEDSSEFFKIYFNWFEQVVLNMQKITGAVIDLDWIPEK